MLVAGGSGSIGSAIARQAAAQGWAIAVHGRTAAKVEGVLQELAAVDATAQGFLTNICPVEAAQTLIAEVIDRFGRLDAVIDCTATGPDGITGSFPQTDPGAYATFLGMSVGWLQRLVHAAYPHLAREGGSLISFVSDAGRFAAPHQTLIGAARAGAIGFIRNFAMEAARDGIRAHCISPSYVDGSDSARRLGSERMAKAASRAGLGLPTAEDIAPLAVFLCGPGAARITGQIISVNGGLNA